MAVIDIIAYVVLVGLVYFFLIQPLWKKASYTRQRDLKQRIAEVEQGIFDTETEIEQQVQTAIAEARQAEQRAITVAKQGEASAAQAKWEQEVIKAKAVTEGEQKLAVATLEAQAADQYKTSQIRRAEGDSTYTREVMQADGALAQKLAAYIQVQTVYADAIKNHQGPWVPSVVMGGNSSANNNGALPLIDMLTAKTARELGLDLGVKSGATNNSGGH